ncbi:MAG: hypothetical protein Q8M54_09510 [Desulfobaccales bacterium]|nr:hypothetical protein [Desulfobaccales bacterium]
MNLEKLVWLALLLLLGGCRALPPAPPPTAILAIDELWSRLQSRQQQVQSFQGRGRVIFLSPERNYSGTALLKGKAPATLRLDIQDFLGRSVLSFASDGVDMQVLSPKEGKLFRGKATPPNLAYALIPPAVTLPQVLSLLKGGLPLSAGPPDRGDYDPAQGVYLLEWRQADGALKERVWVKAEGLNPIKAEWHGDDGQVRFTVELADFGRLPAGLPGQITLRTTTPKSELRLFYKEMLPNPTLAPADLVLTPPEGVEVIRLRP